ncbi:hypothetical protein CHLRE_01g003541v5 [Chlamydomonas reinhardtii]|uniref:Uncharacterized protein n=1 Tax=Chlamydomonas reinhardtii TaxID=3055 RepID=A0A2K3E4W1_CHLRE|nr:uncharacterized protein CHLRE_01g003541v5 [Chlamydomonas reinhardtii]PNW87829.1 hypothetical protein CHLRE_01g003541v5 [Chlamydomonas reinhardtii]
MPLTSEGIEPPTFGWCPSGIVSGGLESDAPPLRHEALVREQKPLRGDATRTPPRAPTHTVPVLTTSSIDSQPRRVPYRYSRLPAGGGNGYHTA